MKNLNLGCGHDFRYDKSWVNLDISFPANVIGDINEGLPFKAASFVSVWASHILEHIQDLRALQMDLARIIIAGGELRIIVPDYQSPDAWGDPTHCRAFSKESFQSCYWVGFNPVELEVKTMKKKPWMHGVDWIFATLRRNGIPYSQVRSELSGRNMVKTGGVH